MMTSYQLLILRRQQLLDEHPTIQVTSLWEGWTEYQVPISQSDVQAILNDELNACTVPSVRNTNRMQRTVRV